MPAPISVVIPALNAADALPKCLDALTPGLSVQILREVVVVDGGSHDATIAVAGGAGCRVVAARAGRGRQLSAGAGAAKGDWLLFLHADTALAPNWADEAMRHMVEQPALAATFTLAYASEAPEARWLEKRAARRCQLLGLPYGDQGLLIPRALYDAVGGYEDAPLMEDVAIVRKIGRRRLRMLNAAAITDASKYERDGWRKRAWRNAFLLARYYLGATPEKLAKSYD